MATPLTQTLTPGACDWCRIATLTPGDDWHPAQCGRMTDRDAARLSPVARGVHLELRAMFDTPAAAPTTT